MAKYSEAEFLQDFVRRLLNKEVRERIKKQANLEDLSTPESSILNALTHKDRDSLLTTILKLQIYQLLLPGVSADDFFITPLREYQRNVRYRPQLVFFFRENHKEAVQRSPQQSQKATRASQTVTLRLEEGSYPESKLEKMAGTIEGSFKNYTFKTGRTTCWYRDREQGIHLKISAFSEQEGMTLIKKVLGAASISYQDKWFGVAESKYNFDEPVKVRNHVQGGQKSIFLRPVGNTRLRKVQFSSPGAGNYLLVARGRTRLRPMILLDDD